MLEEEHHNFSFNPLIKKFMSWKVIYLNEPSNEGGITIIKHLAQLCCVLVNERTHFQFFCFSEKKKKERISANHEIELASGLQKASRHQSKMTQGVGKNLFVSCVRIWGTSKITATCFGRQQSIFPQRSSLMR